MEKTPKDLQGEKYYEVYRRSLIERHITSNGRLVQVIGLRDGIKMEGGLFAANSRWSEETYNDGNCREYYGVPICITDSELLERIQPSSAYDRVPNVPLARGDNPLLQGGLALATFSLEVLHGIDDPNSYQYACKLFDFFLESELIDTSGDRTGFLTRRESFVGHDDDENTYVIPSLRNASTDELSGCLLGLFLFWQASMSRKDNKKITQIEELLTRIATFLEAHQYIYVPFSDISSPQGEEIERQKSRALAFVYMYPFSKLFEHVLGNPFLPDEFPDRDMITSLVDFTDPLSFLIVRTWSDTVGAAPLALYVTILESLAPLGEITDFENFYNFSMTCHTVVLTLLNPSVSETDKALVATAATQMLLSIMRYEEQVGYHNAYFAVTAALCRQYAPPSAVEHLEAVAAMTPGALDDEAVEAGGFLLRQTCRAADWISAAAGTWAANRQEQCKTWKDSRVEEAHEKGSQARSDCKESGRTSEDNCRTEYEDDLNNCTDWRDEGYSVCSTFQSCSDWPWVGWICDAAETLCNWVSYWVCRGYAQIPKAICDTVTKIKEGFCNFIATAVEWGTVAGATLLNWGCQAGTWFVSIFVGLVTWGLKLATCHSDRTWDERISNGLRPLLEPKDIFFRDLPITGNKNNEIIVDPLLEFSHTNTKGDDLLGEAFTWEHCDPNHCFADRCNWNEYHLWGHKFPTTSADGSQVPVRAEAAGLDFLYPRMLVAHINKGPLPTIENSALYACLPVVGASIKYRIEVSKA